MKTEITPADLLCAACGYVEATEIARRALSLMRRSLSQGVSHSRKTLEAAIPELEKKLAECKLSNKHEFAHIATNKRQFDLVRYMRSELHEANLITDAEYFWLCADAPLATSEEGGSPSRERLEDYDAMRDAITEAHSVISALCPNAEKAISMLSPWAHTPTSPTL